MNLTVTEQETLQGMPVQIKPIIEARLSKPIRLYTDSELELEIAGMAVVAHAEKGLKLDQKDDVITFIRNTMARDLRAPKFANISLQLIRLFISNGIRGQYGTFKNQLNTVSVENIHFWINKGLGSEDYKRSVTEFNKKLAEQEYKPKVYNRITTNAAIVNSFENYKKTGEMPYTPYAYYDIINESKGVEYNGKKTLVSDPDARKTLVLQCEAEIAAELNPEREKALKRGRLTEAESLMRAISGEGNTLANKIKKAFLKHYFDQLISKNEPLGL